tara:strand:- start:756 stop:947 length:192 start_codon:yes stop_codon:yes gene_type:complete
MRLEVLHFLDRLRDIGTVDMESAVQDIARYFVLEESEVSEIVAYWRATRAKIPWLESLDSRVV